MKCYVGAEVDGGHDKAVMKKPAPPNLESTQGSGTRLRDCECGVMYYTYIIHISIYIIHILYTYYAYILYMYTYYTYIIHNESATK